MNFALSILPIAYLLRSAEKTFKANMVNCNEIIRGSLIFHCSCIACFLKLDLYYQSVTHLGRDNFQHLEELVFRNLMKICNQSSSWTDDPRGPLLAQDVL